MSGSADDRLANLLASLSRGLADLETSELQAQTGWHGAAPTALLALRELDDGANIARLADELGLTHSGAVRLVQQLEGAGLVRRTRRSDRRSVFVLLTAKGRRLADQAAAARLAGTRSLTAALTRSERRELERLLDHLVADLAGRRAERRRDDPSAGAQPWLCRHCDFSACGRPAGRCPAARAAAAVFADS